MHNRTEVIERLREHPDDWPTCACGCGEPVSAAKATNRNRGIIKGQPNKYAKGHNGRWKPPIRAGLKTCSKCGEEKPLDSFHRSRAERDGHRPACKACARAYMRDWVLRNPEKRAEQHRRYSKRHPETARRMDERSKRRNPEKHKARRLTQHYLRTGRLVRPNACERCGHEPGLGAAGQSLIQAHHADYSKPLEVEWICIPCHHELHGYRAQPHPAPASDEPPDLEEAQQ